VLKLGYFIKQIRNTFKVFESGAWYGWENFSETDRVNNKYNTESNREGISNIRVK
jgi:hypothetical protein